MSKPVLSRAEVWETSLLSPAPPIDVMVVGRGTPANTHESAVVPGLALALKDYGVRVVVTREEKGAQSQYGLERRPTRGHEPHALTDDLVRLARENIERAPKISLRRLVDRFADDLLTGTLRHEACKGARRLCLKTRGDMSIHIRKTQIFRVPYGLPYSSPYVVTIRAYPRTPNTLRKPGSRFPGQYDPGYLASSGSCHPRVGRFRVVGMDRSPSERTIRFGVPPRYHHPTFRNTYQRTHANQHPCGVGCLGYLGYMGRIASVGSVPGRTEMRD